MKDTALIKQHRPGSSETTVTHELPDGTTISQKFYQDAIETPEHRQHRLVAKQLELPASISGRASDCVSWVAWSMFSRVSLKLALKLGVAQNIIVLIAVGLLVVTLFTLWFGLSIVGEQTTVYRLVLLFIGWCL